MPHKSTTWSAWHKYSAGVLRCWGAGVLPRSAARSVGRGLVIALALAVAVPLTAQQERWYRPLSLGDMVDAVGTNPEGMPDDLLGERITTYALHIGDREGVGVSVRFANDPDGDILAGWRMPGDISWQWGWIEAAGLGRLEALRPVGDYLAVETVYPDKRIDSIVVTRAIEVLAVADGRVSAVTRNGDRLTIVVGTGNDRRTLTCTVGSRCR